MPLNLTNDRGYDIAQPENLDEKLTAVYFGAAFVTLIGLFAVSHLWTNISIPRGWGRSNFSRSALFIPTYLRRWTVMKLPGFTSQGHAMAISIYIIINVILTFVNASNAEQESHLARRLGWMAILNMAFLFFLALKNTPLAFLTAYSYERLNGLHQIVGYTTILYTVIHAIAFIPVRVHQNELWNMINPEQRDGIIATVAMLVILATSLFLRRRSYEFFYYVHLVMALVAIAGTYVHRSGFDSSFIAIICAAIWIPDRAIRGMRYLWNRRGNQATLTPLAAGGVSVELSKPLWRAVPGTHLFLTVPGVNKVQAHPLTIVSTDPLKLVFKAQNGFTRKLREYALSHPGQTLTASVDGPYGTIPTFANYDKVLFLAGGAGASFTFGCALEMLSKTTSATAKSIEFIWTVREHAQLSWFASEIAILKAAPNVSVSIYVTGSSQLYLEKGNNRSIGSGEKVNSPVATNDAPGSISNALFPLEDCETKRPDILAIVQETISSASKDETVAIGACGPTGLINSSRNATAKNIRPGGPRVELHCEDFSW